MICCCCVFLCVADLPALSKGLKLLAQLDPNVLVLIEGSQQLIVASGELHLQVFVVMLFC